MFELQKRFEYRRSKMKRSYVHSLKTHSLKIRFSIFEVMLFLMVPFIFFVQSCSKYIENFAYFLVFRNLKFGRESRFLAIS